MHCAFILSCVYFRYESSAAEYKSALEETMTNVSEKSQHEERKTSDSSAPGTAPTTFLVSEVKLELLMFCL